MSTSDETFKSKKTLEERVEYYRAALKAIAGQQGKPCIATGCVCVFNMANYALEEKMDFPFPFVTAKKAKHWSDEPLLALTKHMAKYLEKECPPLPDIIIEVHAWLSKNVGSHYRGLYDVSVTQDKGETMPTINIQPKEIDA